ncbi:formate dehydrogenase subunit gamma [Porticoccaceae bacterium]|nr:formate dehydrogenase subunit gamma [Porticoccaceae bacterium]MDC3261493.1 formate dehydrogenase subunit gamma [bacterium]MDB4427101.1 formate dehydrogenase subunit gamma [Porticoccaceae bacterium]MDC0589619.1 formate dehydrogenase subunit gamma [Porticoccaceae bacterium]MDG1079927.1 formate dehydrogenase subunit gamma [Porticoccaceae bacterium]
MSQNEQQSISALVGQYTQLPGALLPLLHAIQSDLGYVPDSAVPIIAKGLNLSRAEVHGVISFYHDFKTTPVGRHTVQVCRAEACQSMGSRQLEAHAKQALGIDYGETTADGAVTLEPVYCLGNCACSPSVRIDDAIYARVDTDLFDDLMSGLLTEEGASK